jgi:TPR repeat protein
VFQPLRTFINAISCLIQAFAFEWVNMYRYNVAQYELGEMFHRGLFTDSVELFLARKYLTLAAEQGHTEAVARLEDMRRDKLRLEEMRRDGFRCVFCGADDAPNACSYCLNARYCDMECSIAHWRHGGGFASTLGAAEESHRETCARTLARRERRARKKSEEEEVEDE